MAELPTPRALPQILGGMVDDYLGRLDTSGIAPGLKSLKPGSSVLAFLEAVGQSQARGAQDMMNVLNADDIERARGARLDRIGRAERVYRRGETFARGTVTLGDSRLQKVQTRIYAGQPAPIPGSNVLYAADASTFGQTGSLYLGRGTSNVEGPLPFIRTEHIASSYWRITLAGTTTRYHNPAESIVLAQQGDRAINIGQVVGTPQGSSDNALYSTQSRVVLLDGEDSLPDVPVICLRPGTVGNVASGGISFVQGPAFTGMTVTNPQPIQNGLSVEDDDHYRERIKSVRASRAKAVPAAIVARAYGLQSSDENSTIVNARLVVRSGYPSTLYIDDGAAYEEKDAGINQEVLVDSANGGETTFHLAYGRPVQKATAKTISPAPYALADGMTLAVEVGGVRYEHNFVAADFLNIANASAYEVVASVNKNSVIGFNARTFGGGKFVSLFSRQDTNEDLTVLASEGQVALLLPTGRVDTLRLYKNDRLLFKDGKKARLLTQAQSRWTGFQDGETLVLDVDGTGFRTYSIQDVDFVSTGTGYATVNETNSLESWVAVLNAKLPGVTVSTDGASLELVSNLGAQARASLKVDQSSTLVLKGMLSATSLEAAGRDDDYTLDRNLGAITLAQPLSSGDRLSAGTPFTRAYLESGEVLTTTLPATGRLWFAVDGRAIKVQCGLDATHTLTLTGTTATPCRRITATATNTGAAAYPFTFVQVGDWAILTAALFGTALGLETLGAFRISAVDPTGQWFEVDAASSYLDVTTANLGTAYKYLSFFRCSSAPQKVEVPAGTYTAFDVADLLNVALRGLTSSTYETTRLRVTTNTYGPDGDVALLTLDDNAAALMLGRDTSVNDLPHFAAVESGNSECGTPVTFLDSDVQSATSRTAFTFSETGAFGVPAQGSVASIHWLRPFIPTTDSSRYGQNNGRTDQVKLLDVSEQSVTLRDVFRQPTDTSVGADRFVATNGFHLGPVSRLDLVLDRDPLGQGYSINMFRRLVPDPEMTFGTAMKFFDADLLDSEGLPVSLLKSFGSGFDFSDFVLYSHARGVTHASTSTKTVLWRLNEFWNTSESVVSYRLPTLPSQKVNVTWTSPRFNISVALSSGARRNVSLTSEKVTVVYVPGTGTYLTTGFRGLSLTRLSGVVTCTPTLPAGLSNHGYRVGDIVFLSLTDSNFSGGFKTITGVTATTFTYAEVGTDMTRPYASGTITWTVAALDFTQQLTDGDIVSVQGIGAASARVSARVSSVHPTYVIVPDSTLVGATSDVPQFVAVPNADAIQFFPLDRSVAGTGSSPITAAWLVEQVNSLSLSPINGTLGGTGSGVIDRPSSEDASGACSLLNGILHIGFSTEQDTNYVLTTKYAVSGTAVDWANEEFRLVPTTTKNLVAFLSTPAVTGLSLSGATVLASAAASKLQLASGTLGAASAIQVTGGSANEARFVIQGSASSVSDAARSYAKVSAKKTSDLDTMTSGMHVSIDGLRSVPKQTGWANAILSVASNKVQTNNVPALPVWSFSSNLTAPIFPGSVYVESHGRFTAITLPLGVGNLDAAKVGDYLTVPSSEGSWAITNRVESLAQTTAAHVTMANGSILVIAGPGQTVNEYNPTTKAWTVRAELPVSMAKPVACRLNDGRILVAGGYTDGTTVTGDSYIYTPGSDSWASTGALHVPRAFHTLTVMSDGLVWACGGEASTGNALSSFEVFAPSSGTWTLMPNSIGTARTRHAALRFGGDQVALFGGLSSAGGASLAAVDVMTNYATRVWVSRGPLQSPRGYCVAVALPNSKVLVAGGDVAACDLYDLTTFTSASAGRMNWMRRSPAVANLLDGRILLIGGVSASEASQRAVEVYSPNTNSWGWVASLPGNVTHGHSAVVGSTSTVATVGIDGTDEVGLLLDLSISGPQAGNVGTWRVVASNATTIWVENDASVEEQVQVGHLLLRAYGSVMPGDTLQVGTQKLGVANQGSFQVNSIDLTDRTSFIVTGMTDHGAVDLGSDTSLVQVLPTDPSRTIMQVWAIVPNAVSQDLVDFILQPCKPGYSADDLCLDRISEAGGCVISALDKLAFPTEIRVGSDAYRYNTGLLGEANRVLYGDESDRATYPGYIGAGQVVNMAAALVRRVKVSVAVRIRAGSNPKVRIQNAIAKVINSAGPNPIPLSDIIKAVRAVDGVLSVVLLSPSYDSTHDTIPVQPYETPRILDLDSDIRVSIIGQ